MKLILSVCLVLTLMGCGTPKIKSGKTTITAQPTAEDLSLKKSDSRQIITVPAGTTMKQTKTEATDTSPAQEVTDLTFPAETTITTFSSQETATTGKINTKVAVSKIESEERRPLLYGAMICVIAAGFFVWRAYPTGAYLSGAAALVFFLAWKISDLPSWYWGVGVAAAAIAVGIYFGYEKKEQHLKEGK